MPTSKKETPMKVTALTVLALLLATSAHAAEKPSQSFLKKAIQGNYSEVEMGKLAQRTARATR
jgi:putative membrane protein